MKKNGFTLVELLGVIIVMVLIAALAIPVIGDVIRDNKRGAFRNSAYAVVDAAEQYYYYSLSQGTKYETEIDVMGNTLAYTGTLDSGTVYINDRGKVAIAVTYSGFCATKRYDDKEITITDGNARNCKINITDYKEGEEIIIDEDRYYVLEERKDTYLLILAESLGNMAFDEWNEGRYCNVYKADTTYNDPDCHIDSTLYTYLNTEWKNSLPYKDKIKGDVILITKEQYERLDGKNIPWLNIGINWWTMTGVENTRNKTWFISQDGNLERYDIIQIGNSYISSYVSEEHGVRPVIEVSKKDL